MERGVKNAPPAPFFISDSLSRDLNNSHAQSVKAQGIMELGFPYKH